MLFAATVAAFTIAVGAPVSRAQAVDNQPAAPAPVDPPPAAPADAADPGDTARSPIVRRLLAALEEMDQREVDAREREMWRSLLLAADGQLDRAAGDNAEQLAVAPRTRCALRPAARAYGVTYYYDLRKYPYRSGRAGAGDETTDDPNVNRN